MTALDSKDIPSTRPFANLHGMIVCTNSSMRLWPLARERAPLELNGDTNGNASPLAKTIKAMRPYCESPLIIAVPHDIALYVKKHIAEAGLLEPDEYHLLVEPHRRGDALTCALAAATVKLTDPHAILLCVPATVTFECDNRWEQALKRAYRAAKNSKIALIGSSVAPLTKVAGGQSRIAATSELGSDKPPLLLGTVRMGAECKDIDGVYQVRSFIARPTPALAWRAQQNKSLWSTHIFMVRADLALAELRSVGHESNDPSMQSVQRIAETARFFVALGDEHWSSKEAAGLVETLPTSSFEEAVFETTKLLVAVPTSVPFADLTTLAGYEQSIKADSKGNRLRGKALAVQTKDTTILSDGAKLVVALGLEDAIIIDTEDATLITTRDGLTAIPSLIATLRTTNAPEL
ncbi:MAG: hypothetical protein LBL27_00125 [Coriobacteriales bacterium]|jgi:mannose-1-phosphate guanylyltransferase|nr:hypothetical protein [Coriobacteriales bacterium]